MNNPNLSNHIIHRTLEYFILCCICVFYGYLLYFAMECYSKYLSNSESGNIINEFQTVTVNGMQCIHYIFGPLLLFRYLSIYVYVVTKLGSSGQYTQSHKQGQEITAFLWRDPY